MAGSGNGNTPTQPQVVSKRYSRVDSIESPSCSPSGGQKKNSFIMTPKSSNISQNFLSKVDLYNGAVVSRDSQKGSPVRGRAYAGVAIGSNHGNVAIQQVVGKSGPMADPTIRQAYVSLYQNRMNNMRKGDSSFRYDLEAVGVKQGTKKMSKPRGYKNFIGSPRYSQQRKKTNDQIRKLDTRIFAEQVVESFPKDQSQISQPLSEAVSPVSHFNEFKKPTLKISPKKDSANKSYIKIPDDATHIMKNHKMASKGNMTTSSGFNNTTHSKLYELQKKPKSCSKINKVPTWNQPESMTEEQKEKIFGSKRSPTVPLKKAFFEHPSEKFVAMSVPIAKLNKKQQGRDFSDQINYILNAFMSQPAKTSKHKPQ